MTARDDILGRVRSALGHAPRALPATSDDVVAGATETSDATPPEAAVRLDDLVGLFVERVEDYRAVVVRCRPADVAAAIRDGLGDARRVLVPAGFPDGWLGALDDRVERVVDTDLTAYELDAVDAVVTTATLGIAVTGTIVLDHGPGQGRRALTLVPDRHVCVVTSDQVVADVPDGVRALDPLRPLTWVSGPSATSDIELDRVEGVHGPRNLHVLVIDLP